VWPLALRYTERGIPSAAAAFIGDMGLVTSLARTLVARDLVIRITVLPAIEVTLHENRHAVARAARAAIAKALGMAAADPDDPSG
jgi:hypothetical protein